METTTPAHRIWAEIDLDALVHNYRQICHHVAPAEVMCVIKADAYGHGAIPVAKALSANGAHGFGVATPEEAMQLRRHGFVQPILLLGMAASQWVPRLAQAGVTLAVGSLEGARQYAKALEGTGAKVHVKVDTGMGRIGLPAEEATTQTLAIAALQGVEVTGLFTHFAAADEDAEDDYTAAQLQRLHMIVQRLEKKGMRGLQLHWANSAGIIKGLASGAQLVRPGIMLYGSNPCLGHPFPLQQPLSLRTRITQVKQVAPGDSIGYGRRWRAEGPATIATVAAGYADGLPRALSGNMHMLVHGRPAPQVGRICMDACMLDVTGIPGVQGGDTATIIGISGDARITADELAAAAGTIAYELFCGISPRVPRLYYTAGRLVDEVCYIDSL